MDKVVELVKEMGLFGWIAVIAVAAIVGQTVIVIKKMNIKHSERMAKIANGINPGDEDAASVRTIGRVTDTGSVDVRRMLPRTSGSWPTRF